MRKSYVTALLVLVAMVVVPSVVRADGYATDVDDLDLGPLEHHPGAPGQDYWYYGYVEGDAVTEIQDAIANPGRAFHLLAPLTNPPNVQTIIRRDITPPDLSALPIVTLSFDFYCNTSDETAWNWFSASCAVVGGPHPGFVITKIALSAGNGTPRDITGLDVMVWAHEPGVGGVPIPLTVGQDLSWDTWHSISLSLDQNRDTFLSITVDGDTQDLQGYYPDRTFYEEQWLRGELMETIIGEVVSHEWPDPFYETDDHLYIDNFSIQAEPATYPIISSIADVGNDQGRMVRIKWNHALYDAPGEPVVTSYDIYRREDGGRPAGWDYVSSVPACGDSAYQSLASTLCDSTAGGGICWSTFFVRAMTTDPLEYFDSPPDSGYSVDNLAPGVPENFLVNYTTTGNELAWEENVDEDFEYFNVYRGDEEGFEPVPGNLIHQTIDIAWLDTGGTTAHFYKLTAVDHAGNESAPAIPETVMGVPDGPAQASLALYQNAPNPARPTTGISYDIPTGGSEVSLEIFDVDGRLVRVLVSGAQSAGRHVAAWDGRDDSGRPVSSGFYLYRLTGPEFEETRKMVVTQ